MTRQSDVHILGEVASNNDKMTLALSGDMAPHAMREKGITQ